MQESYFAVHHFVGSFMDYHQSISDFVYHFTRWYSIDFSFLVLKHNRTNAWLCSLLRFSSHQRHHFLRMMQRPIFNLCFIIRRFDEHLHYACLINETKNDTIIFKFWLNVQYHLWFFNSFNTVLELFLNIHNIPKLLIYSILSFAFRTKANQPFSIIHRLLLLLLKATVVSFPPYQTMKPDSYRNKLSAHQSTIGSSTICSHRKKLGAH